MKKYIYIFAAVAALAACSKEVATNEEIQNQPAEAGVRTVTFTATLESPDTKGSIASTGAFTWSSGDKIAVWTNVGKQTATATSISGSSAEFTFSLGEGESIPNDAIFVYPDECLTGPTNVNILPFIGDSPETTKGPVLAAKIGTGSERSTLNFKYVCATVEMTITDVPVFANNIEIGLVSGQAFIGSASINFSGDDPSLSDYSMSDKVTLWISSGGSKTIKLPIPKLINYAFQVRVKNDNVEYFYKNTPTLTPTRKSYFKMKDLAVKPTVYLYSNMTGWDGDGVPMTVSGDGDASLKLTSLGGQYFRVKVVCAGNNFVYGATGSDITTLPATLTLNGTDKAVKISDDLGVYTISFDYTTAQASVTKETENPVFYTGSDSMSSMEEMTPLSSTKAYNVRKWQNNIYAYYNQYTASRAHWDLGSGDKYYLFLYNANTNALTPQYFTANDKSWTNVWIEYTTDNWTNRTKLEMDNVSGTPIWSKEITLSGDAMFYFRGKGSNWEADQSRGTILSISGYTATVGAVDGKANDYSIAAGIYTFLFCEDGRQLVVLNHS